MTTRAAHAKINLGLVVGPPRRDGKHEVVTVLQRVDLHDDVSLEEAEHLSVTGFADDTLVTTALRHLGEAAGVEPDWHVHIEKRIPVASGLGGGSSDAATALALANDALGAPLTPTELHAVAASVGADVPFFLGSGAQLATGDGTELTPVDLPSDYQVLLVLEHGATKASTGAVYEAFDRRSGSAGFEERADSLRVALERVSRATDLAALPENDLASSSLVDALVEGGAFRASVSGAGPAVYGLFERDQDAAAAAAKLSEGARTFVTRPVP